MCKLSLVGEFYIKRSGTRHRTCRKGWTHAALSDQNVELVIWQGIFSLEGVFHTSGN